MDHSSKGWIFRELDISLGMSLCLGVDQLERFDFLEAISSHLGLIADV